MHLYSTDEGLSTKLCQLSGLGLNQQLQDPAKHTQFMEVRSDRGKICRTKDSLKGGGGGGCSFICAEQMYKQPFGTLNDSARFFDPYSQQEYCS